MGAFLVNLHVRCGDRDSLVREITDLRTGGCYLAPPKGGWASIYEQRASTQDEQWIRHFGGELSRRLQAPAIAFLVHDSDFVCYWLFDQGELLDEFNSCPGYFEEDWSEGSGVETMRGRPDVLRRFCRRGVRVDEIEAALQQESLFAEGQLEKLAGLMGIEVERVMSDFQDFGREMDPAELGVELVVEGETDRGWPFGSQPNAGGLSLFRAEDEEELDEDEDAIAPSTGFVARNLQRLFGVSRTPAQADPLNAQLVEAASKGDVAAIERLVAEGADVNGTAPLKIDLDQQLPGLGQVAAGMLPAFEMSPLLAAISGKQVAAADKLIELKADVTLLHPLFGTPVHAAASGGAPELLKLLLAAGARVNERNAQGQTPLAALQAARQVLDQFTRLQSLGLPLPKQITSRLEQSLPVAGWDECERLLREAGGR